MARNIDVDQLVKMQQEIFKDIKSKSRKTKVYQESNFYALRDKFNEYDDTLEYTIDDIRNFFNMFVSSEFFTKENAKELNEITIITLEEEIKRGREALLLISGNRITADMFQNMCSRYTKKDKTQIPYNRKTIDKYMYAFEQVYPNDPLLEEKKIAMALTAKGVPREYDFKLIDQLVSMNLEDAVTYIKAYKIPKDLLNKLRNAYGTVYQDKEHTRILNMFDEIITHIRRTSTQVQKRVQPKRDTKVVEESNVRRLKDILTIYINADYYNVNRTLKKFGSTLETFERLKKSLENTDDKELKDLIDRYELKSEYALEYFNKNIDIIYKWIIDGIDYGNGIRKLNYYDVCKFTSASGSELVHFADVLGKRGKAEKIRQFYNVYQYGKTYSNIEIMLKEVRYSKQNKVCTEEERRSLAEYMVVSKLPLHAEVFMGIQERYLDGDLILTPPEKKK